MHEPQPIPRRENTTKTFDDDLIARTLSNAADIRRALSFSQGRTCFLTRTRTSQRPGKCRSGIDRRMHQAGINGPMSGRFSGTPETSAGTLRHVSRDTSVMALRPTTTTPTQRHRKGRCRPR